MIDISGYLQSGVRKKKELKSTLQRKKDITDLCKIAHLNQEGVKKGLEPLKYDFVDFFDIDGLQGYVAKNYEGQVLIYRESDSIIKEPIDWIHNFMAWKTEFEGKKYHTGYFKLFTENQDRIMNKIDDLSLIIGGFSLGGGMSEVTANILEDTTGFDTWFANIDGCAVIEENGYKNGIHTVNSNDPVPICTLPLGYKHFGDTVYFTFRGNTYINPKRVFRYFDFIAETVEDIIEYSKCKIDFEHNITEINKNWHKGMNKIEKILI